MHSHSTPKGAPAYASKLYDWDLRKIAKISPKMTIKYVSILFRLLYRTCGFDFILKEFTSAQLFKNIKRIEIFVKSNTCNIFCWFFVGTVSSICCGSQLAAFLELKVEGVIQYVKTRIELTCISTISHLSKRLRSSLSPSE